MKKIISFLVILCLLAGGTSFAGVKMIRDEKYGKLSDKFFIYLSPTHEEKKTAVLNLARVFSSYQRSKDYDAVLVKESHEFESVRDSMIKKFKQGLMDKSVVLKYDSEKRAGLTEQRDDKVRDILTEIQKVVSDYAVKNQIRAVVNDQTPHLKGDEVDISNDIITLLNSHYALIMSTKKDQQ